MKTKILSVLLALLILLSISAPAVYAEGNFVLTLDDEERFTDIIEASDEQDRTYFDIKESSAAMSKTTYVVILSVLLAISVVVLVFTLHKQKKLNEEDADDAETPESDSAEESADSLPQTEHDESDKDN